MTRGRWGALLLATALGLAAKADAPWRSALVSTSYAAAGRALIGNAPQSEDPIAYHMPASSVVAARLFERVSDRTYARGFLIAAVVLSGAVAAVAFGPLSGGAAALLTALALWRQGEALGTYPQPVLSLVWLTLAGLAVGGSRRTLALASGAALLFRSSLLPVPLALGAWRRNWFLAAAPFLLLAPWVKMTGRITEAGQADANVIASGLGLTQTLDGDARALLPQGDGSAWLFAARRPLVVLGGFFRRLGWTLSQNPWLWLLAALGLWTRWGEPAGSAVAALLLAHLIPHCLLAIQLDYLLPLWPLLAVLAAGALAERRPARWAKLVLLAFAALLIVAGLDAAFLCARYTGKGALSPYSAARRGLEAIAADEPALRRWTPGDLGAPEAARLEARAALYLAAARLKAGDEKGAKAALGTLARVAQERVIVRGEGDSNVEAALRGSHNWLDGETARVLPDIPEPTRARLERLIASPEGSLPRPPRR